MKRMWLAYVGVTILGVLVGVAIAGIPSGNDVAVSPISSIADPDTSDTVDTVAATTIDVTTTAAEAETTTTVAETTTASSSTTTSTSTSTTTTTTATTTTTTTTTVPLPDRSDIVVVSVNGANVAGLAGRTTELLIDLGYTQTRSTDGSVFVETTVIYFADDRLAEAERLAADLELVDPQLLPIDDDVPFNVLEDDVLVVYLGLDRA